MPFLNFKQSSILQFTLTRGIRSKRQFHKLLRWPIYIINWAHETKLSCNAPAKAKKAKRFEDAQIKQTYK